MQRTTVDLASPLNQTIERGHPADFPISLKPVFYGKDHLFTKIPKRLAVVREDTDTPIAVVSDRYKLVPHQEILDIVGQAIEPLDLGPVPRGIYVDRGGARMRALFKFPSLAKPVIGDDICPCLKIQNTYDGTSRISIHIGAFRFVCTNLAVGGGGVFAGGFMSVHAGAIPIDKVAEQLGKYLTGFDEIVELYRHWTNMPFYVANIVPMLATVPKRHSTRIIDAIAVKAAGSVYEAYNVATHYATHRMRSYRTAFDLLERINHGFQKAFPVSGS